MAKKIEEVELAGEALDQDKADRFKEWQNGQHTSSNGRVSPVTLMDDRHLNNTINKFKARGYDVSPLEAELAKRPNPNENIN